MASTQLSLAAFAPDIEWFFRDSGSENRGPCTMAELAVFYAASSAKDGTLVWHKDIKDEAWASVPSVAGLKDTLAAQAPTTAAGGGGAGGGGDESLSELKSRNGTLVRQLAEKVAEVQTLREQFAEERRDRRELEEQRASQQEAIQSLRTELERRDAQNELGEKLQLAAEPAEPEANSGTSLVAYTGGSEEKVGTDGDAGDVVRIRIEAALVRNVVWRR